MASGKSSTSLRSEDSGSRLWNVLRPECIRTQPPRPRVFGSPPRHPLTPQTPLATPQLRGLLAIPPASGQAPGATPWPTLSPRASVPLPPPPPSLLRRQLAGPRGLHWSPWRKQLLSQAARPLPPLQATAPASIGPVASLTGLFVCHLPSPLECNCREGPRSRFGSSASYRLGGWGALCSAEECCSACVTGQQVAEATWALLDSSSSLFRQDQGDFSPPWLSPPWRGVWLLGGR